jgi:hypothetical protein
VTSIYDTIDVAHLVVVVYEEDSVAESGWDRTAERYRAECSCGWAGDWHQDGALAEADGDDHREVVIGPGDKLDRLMGELLDLEDDLAQLVMWLAEYWSADLPVPHSRGVGSDVANVELWAYCVTDEDLTRAAAVLGVSLADNPAPDTRGNRYRRAERRFGRVRLMVFRRIAVRCEECDTELAGTACPTCGEHPDAGSISRGAA